MIGIHSARKNEKKRKGSFQQLANQTNPGFDLKEDVVNKQ